MERDLPHDSTGIITLLTVKACFENKEYITCIGHNDFIQIF